MLLTKKLAASPAMVSLMTWLNVLGSASPGSSKDVKLKLDFVVHKTDNGRWCWELIGKDGRVHGRSTPEFVRREQAVCATHFIQCVMAESAVTDADGQPLHVDQTGRSPTR